MSYDLYTFYLMKEVRTKLYYIMKRLRNILIMDIKDG